MTTEKPSTANHSDRPTRIGLTIAYFLLLLLLVTLPRLTHFWGYLIVDEADRWRWAENFAIALHRGDLAATLVGDGYPGIVPVWAETVWIYAEMSRRSWYAGEWIGMPGLFHLLHQWQRVESLHWQRLPIVILNTLLALAIITAVWRLFGRQVGLLAGILIALDPFYLSDSRVNRAEAVITGLMTLSILALIFYVHRRRWWWIVISGIFGGLSLLTKIQALVIIPAVALILLSEEIKGRGERKEERNISYFLSLISYLSLWIVTAGLVWFLLWPAMWVTPLETLTLVYNYTTRKVGAEGVNLFFWGQTYRDADPGLLFYPFVFVMRLTPVALIGLLGFVVGGGWFLKQSSIKQLPEHPTTVSPMTLQSQFQDSAILLIYILAYLLAMSVGSHKQDRYLLPIFLSVDILAAIGWVYLGHWLRAKLTVRRPVLLSQLAIISLIIIQIATIYPHHPYYYSYFNPLLGGGPMASQTLRIGWGEGMDQVADYLSTKPNARDLVVSSRFTHNLVDFKGETISLLPDGRWTQADYIVLYIQQVQRYQEPSPGFLDYFLARTPEKVITIGGIDYARIYPVPFNVSANPQISLLPGQLALLGYRWQDGDSPPAGQPVTMRVLWENLGREPARSLVTRLVGATTETDWAICQPDPAFGQAAQTPGDLVESLCRLDTTLLPTTAYTVEFGLSDTPSPTGTIETISFPEGWLAARLTATGEMTDTSVVERLDLIAQEAIPSTATQLDRVYDERLRLTAYHLEPASPQPGDELTVTLYWQRLAEMLQPLHLTVQLADSRAISLGRQDVTLHVPGWLDGASRPTHHTFRLPADLDTPLAAQIEVSLVNPAKVSLMPTDLTGQLLDKVIGHLTILPATNQPPDFREMSAVWQEGIMLQGYQLSAETVQPGESLTVNLFWQAQQSVADNYVVFVHLVSDTGQLVAQSDSLPRAGAYPTLWWLPRLTIEDSHQITLPAEVSPGSYSLVVGLYEAETMRRLPLMAGGDSFRLRELVVAK